MHLPIRALVSVSHREGMVVVVVVVVFFGSQVFGAGLG